MKKYIRYGLTERGQAEVSEDLADRTRTGDELELAIRGLRDVAGGETAASGEGEEQDQGARHRGILAELRDGRSFTCPVSSASAHATCCVATGTVSLNRAPRDVFGSADSRPPWAWTMERLIASPMPMPWGLVE